MATKHTVLVADDNADICDLLRVGLSRLDVNVVVASTGRQAFDLIVSHRPSVVLLDLVMPELTGLEVLAKLRETADFVSLPVIMLTARTQDEDIDRGYALGASDYVIKPFNLKELISKVAALLAPA